MSNFNVIQDVFGNRFSLSESTTLVAIQNQATVDIVDAIMNDETLPKEDKLNLLNEKNATDAVVKSILSAGNVIITSIKCFPVCAAAFKILRETNLRDGGLVILGTARDFKSSGLSKIIMGTPRCYALEIASQKGTEEEEKALIEEYNAYKEEYKNRKEEASKTGADFDEPKMVKYSAASREAMLIAKMMADVCDMGLFIGKSFRSVTASNNFLLRNLLASGTPGFIYPSTNVSHPKSLVEVDLSSIKSEVAVYKDTDAVKYDSNEIINTLLNKDGKLSPTVTHLFTKVDLDQVLPKEVIENDFKITGVLEAVNRKFVQGIFTPAYTDAYIDAYKIAHPDITKMWDKVTDKIGLVRHELLTKQVESVIEASMESGLTTVTIADSKYGVTTLELAYNYMSENKGKGQLLVLVGEFDCETQEGKQMETVLDKLAELDNVGFISTTRASYKATFPNPKAGEEGEKDTVSVRLSPAKVLAYVAANICSEIYCLSDTEVNTFSAPLKYYALTAGDCKFNDTKLKGKLFRFKDDAVPKSSPRYDCISDVVDLKDIQKAMKIGVRRSSKVNGFEG